MQQNRNRNLLVAVFLFLVCFVTYSNALPNAFLMDDYPIIIDNRAIKDPHFLQIAPFLKSGTAYNSADHVYWRPVTHLLNLFSFLLFNKDPFGYHLLNLLLLYACGIALYELLHSLFNRWQLAFLTSLLFCVHPINGVLVNYITTTGYSVLVLAVILGLRYSLAAQEGGKATAYFLSLFWFSIALLCHEIAVVFPLYLSCVLFFLKNYSFRKICVVNVPFILILIVYAIFRSAYVGFNSGTLAHIPHFHMSLSSYTATFFNLILFYVRNLIFLDKIVLIWASPIIKSNLFLWNIAGAGLLILCLMGMRLYGKRSEKTLALSWFLIGLLPVGLACFSRPNLGFIIETHWMFFASIGFFLFLSSLLLNIRRSAAPFPLLSILMVLPLTASYILSSRQYNKLWSNEMKYCRYMLSLSPGMELPLWWLAYAHLRAHHYAEAKVLFEKTLRGTYRDWETYINLGVIEGVLGNSASAVDYYYRALAVNPNAAEAYSNLAAHLINVGRLDKAEEYLQRAIRLDVHLIEAKKNLTTIYRQQGKVKEAISLLEEILKIDPEDAYSLKTWRDLKGGL